MKGTFFSADFVIDENNNARLTEINTDTGIIIGFKDLLDFDPLVQVLTDNSSSINEFHLVYKSPIQDDLEETVSASIAENCPWITTYEKHKVPLDSIYPTSPADSGSRFILRAAYNENAILDSTYAKGNLETLKLFYDQNNTGSIVEIYHSSSGNYYDNLLSSTPQSQSNVPHVVLKNNTEATHQHLELYSLGSASAASADRWDSAVHELADTNKYLSKFYINPWDHYIGRCRAVRSYHITYGTDLDVMNVATADYRAVFEFPDTIDYDDTKRVQKVNRKHFFEFTTKRVPKDQDNGLLAEEQIQLADMTFVSASVIATGSVVRSYHIAGLPDSDSESVIAAWAISGSSIPSSGSYESTSSLDYKSYITPRTQHIVQILDTDGDIHEFGGRTRLLAYEPVEDKTRFFRAEDLRGGMELVQVSGSNIAVSESYYSVLQDETAKLYDFDVEDNDLFFTKTGVSPKVVVAHNIITPPDK